MSWLWTGSIVDGSVANSRAFCSFCLRLDDVTYSECVAHACIAVVWRRTISDARVDQLIDAIFHQYQSDTLPAFFRRRLKPISTCLYALCFR